MNPHGHCNRSSRVSVFNHGRSVARRGSMSNGRLERTARKRDAGAVCACPVRCEASGKDAAWHMDGSCQAKRQVKRWANVGQPVGSRVRLGQAAGQGRWKSMRLHSPQGQGKESDTCPQCSKTVSRRGQVRLKIRLLRIWADRTGLLLYDSARSGPTLHDPIR